MAVTAVERVEVATLSKILSIFRGFLLQTKEDLVEFISITIIGFTVIIGFIVVFWVPGKGDLGWGIVIGSIVSLTPIAASFVIRKWLSALDIRGVIKVIERQDPLYLELKPELLYEKQIFLLGNVLVRDLFGHVEFREALLKYHSDCQFFCRVCIYAPEQKNPFLRERSKDEVFDKLIDVESQSTTSRAEKDGETKALIDDRVNHNVEQIKETLRFIRDLKSSASKQKGLGDKLEVRLVDNTYILDSILIAGDKIVVCDYLHQSGRYSPILVLKNSQVSEKYKEEFERIWSLAKPAP